MSEKVYFITAKTKGDNPKVVFLTDSTVWRFKSNSALIQTLSDCINYSRQEPTHCLFVEAKASLKEALEVIYDLLTPAELKQLIKEHDCHTVSTKQKKSKPKPAKTEQLQPTPYAAEEQPQKRVGYVLTKRSLNAFDREKKYRCETEVYVMIGEDIADVYMSKEQADFVCYTRNLLYNPDEASHHPWQVEQIEF